MTTQTEEVVNEQDVLKYEAQLMDAQTLGHEVATEAIAKLYKNIQARAGTGAYMLGTGATTFKNRAERDRFGKRMLSAFTSEIDRMIANFSVEA